MSKVSKSIVINAPVRKVFDFVTSPENWTRYVTSLVEVNNMSDGRAAVGSTFSWVYKMMGIKMSGKGTVTNNVRNKSFGLSLKGKATINESYEFADEGEAGTRLKVMIDYEMPSEMLSVIANSKLVEKLNSMESKNVLEKIKAMCEA